MLPELTEADRWSRAIASVRKYIRDHRQLNRLLRGQEETTDPEIQLAISMAIEDWNSAPPPIGRVTIVNHPAKQLLIIKAAVEVLRTAGIWHSREHMPSTDGGTSADDHAKAGEYSGWLAGLDQEYERKRDNFKVAQNINAALGGMGAPSEYSFFYMYGEDYVW
ncbi:MAG TPA: hypothetical protein VLH09_05085 [Bryobacteraceae bacterium]|nr:hypothetical protein [Bryobacteraceae bacterium]